MARALKQPGNCHPQGLKKVRALPIHLNSHSFGPSKCQPQPLNTPLKYYVLQLLCFFFHLAQSLSFVCIRCLLGWLPICSGSQVLQLHTKSQISPLFVLLKVQAIGCRKRYLILGASSKAFNCCFSAPFQVFLHRLNQYAATKIDKNITEETVKVRVSL